MAGLDTLKRYLRVQRNLRLGPPVVPVYPCFGEGCPTKIEHRNKDTHILTSQLEDLVSCGHPSKEEAPEGDALSVWLRPCLVQSAARRCGWVLAWFLKQQQNCYARSYRGFAVGPTSLARFSGHVVLSGQLSVSNSAMMFPGGAGPDMGACLLDLGPQNGWFEFTDPKNKSQHKTRMWVPLVFIANHTPRDMVSFGFNGNHKSSDSVSFGFHWTPHFKRQCFLWLETTLQATVFPLVSMETTKSSDSVSFGFHSTPHFKRQCFLWLETTLQATVFPLVSMETTNQATVFPLVSIGHHTSSDSVSFGWKPHSKRQCFLWFQWKPQNQATVFPLVSIGHHTSSDSVSFGWKPHSKRQCFLWFQWKPQNQATVFPLVSIGHHTSSDSVSFGWKPHSKRQCFLWFQWKPQNQATVFPLVSIGHHTSSDSVSFGWKPHSKRQCFLWFQWKPRSKRQFLRPEAQAPSKPRAAPRQGSWGTRRKRIRTIWAPWSRREKTTTCFSDPRNRFWAVSFVV